MLLESSIQKLKLLDNSVVLYKSKALKYIIRKANRNLEDLNLRFYALIPYQ